MPSDSAQQPDDGGDFDRDLPDESDMDDDDQPDIVPCPHCRRPISEDAVYCPHCRAALEETSSSGGPVMTAAVVIILAMLAAGLVAILLRR